VIACIEMRKIYIVALHQIPFLPYVHGLLRNTVETDEALSREYTFGNPFFLSDALEDMVERMEKPDVVGFSCYVWNTRKQMKLARLVRQRFPECLIVAGGPHVPSRPESFLTEHPAVDVVVHGEGEYVFADLLRQRMRTQPSWHEVAGISFRDRGHTVTAPCLAPRPGRLVAMRSPYLSGHLHDAIESCHRRADRFYALWETNRGCPYSCTFCDWGSATMSKVRTVPDEQIFADIEYFGEQRVPNLFICDANFGILPRDLEIAERLAAANRKYGYPQQVRVNFAKESNDRVFQISQVWADHGMLMGTTLSMQSMDMDVLGAVERRNIGYENFQKLSVRYREAGIHTYSELILGLPLETRQSFEEGIGKLLDGGSHDDIRVFDFMLLPNSPVNVPATLNRYGLKTIKRRMYLDRPDDENEVAEFVVETSSLSREDWVFCQVFAQAVQFLHNGCYTRYVAVHLRRCYQLRYEDFYRRLVNWAIERPYTVLGLVLGFLEKMYRQYLEDDSIPHVHMIASQSEMIERVRAFGNRRGWTPDQWAWLAVASDGTRFYVELSEFVRSLNLPLGDEWDELLRFQNTVVLRIDDAPGENEAQYYTFDFPAYFNGPGTLEKRPLCIRFRDRAMGMNHQYPLEAGNLRRFAKAAVGLSYPLVRIRHFQHQLADAEIVYQPSPEVYAAAY
jgi:putative methyltransferase